MKSIKLNAVLNGLKTICSFIFPLITTPYATRVLTASNYGKVSTSNSIISYFILIANLGIWTYVQREAPAIREDKKKFENFAAEIFTINVIATCFSYIMLAITIFVSVKLKNYLPLLIVQSLQIVLTTIGADWINQVYEDYFYVTVRYLIIQFVSLFSLFLFVKSKNDYIIYSLIIVLAASGGNLFNVFYIRKYTHLHFANLRQCFKHLNPIFKLFAVNIATTIYVSSDITILGLMIGDKEAGVYQLTSKIYSIAKSLMTAILLVALPRLAFYLGNNNKIEYNNLLRNIFNSIATFLFPVIVGLFVLSPQIILILGTNEFLRGTLSLRILCVTFFFSTFASIFATAIILLYKQDNVYLFSTIISSITNIVLNFILIPLFSYNGAALTTLIAEIIMLVILVYFSLKNENIRKNISKIIGEPRIYLISMFGSIVIYFICRAIVYLNYNPFITVVVSVLLSSGFYFLICILFKNRIVLNLIESMKAKL